MLTSNLLYYLFLYIYEFFKIPLKTLDTLLSNIFNPAPVILLISDRKFILFEEEINFIFLHYL